jgi:TetR/AcrR family transcriptional repressor of bet genes
MTMVASVSKKKQPSAIRRARRLQLIEATITSISKRGFSGTTLNSVTEEAGLSHGVVNFHFDSKEALYNETLGHLADEHADHWRAALRAAGDDPAARLRAIVTADFAAPVCTRKKLAVWFAFWGQAKHRPIYLDIHSAHDAERRAALMAACEGLLQAGPYPHLSAATCTRNIEALVDGLWLSLLLSPKACTRQEALRGCFDLLASLFPTHFSDDAAPGPQQSD